METTTDIRQSALRDTSVGEIRRLLATAKVDENSREDLHAFVQLHQLKTNLAMQLSTLNESISKIHVDQERIRENMDAVDRTSEIYARYLKSLSEQEDQLLELKAAYRLLYRSPLEWTEKLAALAAQFGNGPAAEFAEAMGVPQEAAVAYARLGLAVTRGLLLDLLATHDRAAVDAAMEHWIALSTDFIAQSAQDHHAP